MNMISINAFRFWWDLGYRDLLPIVPADAKLTPKYQDKGKQRGKMPGVKYRDGLWGPIKGWYNLKPTEVDIETWNAMGASVGLRTGNTLLLDIDAYDEKTGSLIEETLIRHLGPAPMRVGQWPKRALLYRTDNPFTIRIMKFTGFGGAPGQIEMPAQVVISGTHARTGKPYDWVRDPVPVSTLTTITKAQVEAACAELALLLPAASFDGRDEGESTVTPERLKAPDKDVLRAIVEATPNDYEKGSYDRWRDYGQALRGALPDDPDLGCELFEIYTEKAFVSDPEEDPIRVYNSLGTSRTLGWEYLRDEAFRLTGKRFDAALYFEDGGSSEALFPEDKPEPKPKRSFQFVSFDDAATRATTALQRPLVKGLLDWGAMTILYGPSNVGKTFVTMDLAFHVAAGLPFGGMRTEGGAVVYVAAEGGRGVYARVAALKARYGAAAEGVRFEILPMSVDLRRRDADLSPLIAAVKAIDVPVALIVVDTLSRALAGGDENSSVDMGNIVTHFDMLRQETEAHLLVVHHTGKNLANGARGHSLLRAATDTEIEISDGLFEVTKQRDLPKNWTTGFALDVVRLGADADGDDITSCVVRLVGRDEVDVAGLSPKEVVVLRAVSELDAFADGSGEGDGGIGLADVEDYLARSADKLSKDIIRHSLRSLSAKGAIRKSGRGKWGLNRQNVDWRDPIFTKRDTSCIGESGEESSPNAFE